MSDAEITLLVLGIGAIVIVLVVLATIGALALVRPAPRPLPPVYRVGKDGVDLPKPRNSFADRAAERERDVLDEGREELRRTKTQLRRFRIEGKVLKVWDGPDVVLASGSVVKEAESAEALQAAWERDMRIAFPIGPDYNVEYVCNVTPL